LPQDGYERVVKLLSMISAVVAKIPRLFPLMRDARVPLWSKILVVLLAALVLSPFDLLSDVPVLGVIDDATLLLFIVNVFVNYAERRAA
jgi:uncharacterized membrane protein YkvA (DUF1232 family)